MRRSTSISIIVHYPKSAAGRRELEKRVATVHADAAKEYIEQSQCPVTQKIALAGSAARTATK